MAAIATPGTFFCASLSKDKGWMRGQRSPVQRWRSVFSSPIFNRWKLAVGLAAVLLTIYCTNHAASVMGWSPPSDERSRSLHLSPRNRYTVLINTWKRYDLLKQTVSHYSTCNSVDAIHVIWSEPENPSRALTTKLLELVEPKKLKFRFNINDVDELNNRFKPVEDIDTDALFSVDDDVVVPCGSMDLAFTAWLSAPDQTVGFVPRMHWPDTKSHERYRYGGWWSVWWTGTYSMVLTKAAFIHKKYLQMYTTQMPRSLLDFVKHERNCEDIAMSFLIANITHAPPVWIKARIQEIGSTGISSLTGHKEHRTNCINRFAETFGRMPLVSSRAKVVDASHAWFW